MKNLYLLICLLFLSTNNSYAQLLCQGNIPVTTVSTNMTGWQARGALGHPGNTVVTLCGFPPNANIIGLQWANMQYNTIGDSWCNEVQVDLDSELIIYVESGGSHPGPCGPYAGGSPTILSGTGLEMTASATGCIELQAYLTWLGSPSIGADFTSGILTFTACPQNTPLPVLFKKFDLFASDQYHILDWTTSAEINNRGWEIQRSDKGIVWENIGWIDGTGNSSTEKSYTFTDKYPLTGLNFYRLEQWDFNGAVSHSEIRYLEHRTGGLSIYPNPVKDQLFISGTPENTTFTITDQQGRMILQGSTTEGVIDFAPIRAGSYVLHLKQDAQISHHRIVKVE